MEEEFSYVMMIHGKFAAKSCAKSFVCMKRQTSAKSLAPLLCFSFTLLHVKGVCYLEVVDFSFYGHEKSEFLLIKTVPTVCNAKL